MDTLKQLQGEEGKILTTDGNVNIKWKDSLQELQEKGEKEFYKNFYEDGLFAPGKYNGEVVLNWCNQQTTLAYNAGKADMLDTVLKEIEGMKVYDTKDNWCAGFMKALDTLKNKLLDNK